MILAPYHAAVRRFVRRGCAEISGGLDARALARFSDDAVLQFSGDHVLGGVLQGRIAAAGWFCRVRRYFPTLTVTPLQIVVDGLPWNTTTATRFWVDATMPDGTLYHNEGIQFLRIVWGRIVEARVYEDTDVLKNALLRMRERIPA